SGNQVAVTDLTITVPNATYGDLIINPEITGTIGTPGSATVTVVALEPDNSQQTFTFTYNLGNGNNFLTIVASGGESIISTHIDAPNGGFTDLKQPRISGFVAVPEPSSLVLAGSGALSVLVGYGWRRRRHR